MTRSATSSDDLPEPEEMAEDIISNLQAPLASFQEIANGLAE